jgi:hypothetical protein
VSSPGGRAARHSVDDAKHLQRLNHPEGYCDGQHVAQQWPRDVPEERKASCAVHLGGVKQILRDVVNSSLQQDRVEADIHPNNDPDNGRHGQVALTQPG